MKDFEKVRIKRNGIVGTIVEQWVVNGHRKYAVEADERFPMIEGGYGKEYPIFDCSEGEIEKISGEETKEAS